MNWLKVITKSRRQSLARELLKEHLTPEQISEWASDGANKLLAYVNNKEELNRIACKVNCAADLTADVASAVRDGHVSQEEAAQICARTSVLVGDICSLEALERFIEKVVSLVP